jgi:hypothetical protein
MSVDEAAAEKRFDSAGAALEIVRAEHAEAFGELVRERARGAC